MRAGFEVLVVASEARQRELCDRAAPFRVRRFGWPSRCLEHPLQPLHINHVECQSALADGFDAPDSVLLAQPQQGVRGTHARPGQRAFKDALCILADVLAALLGLGDDAIDAA